MKTIKQIEVIPVFVKYTPPLDQMEEGKIYISKEFKSSSHKCLCGCGSQTVMPLHPVHGWALIENGNKISFTPSVYNKYYDCKAHYIITHNIANFV